MRINTDSSYIEAILEESLKAFSSYTPEKFKEMSDNLALYKSRMEEFGGSKVFRYGNYVSDLAQQAADLSILYAYAPSENILNAIVKLCEMVVSTSVWLSQGIFEHKKADLITAQTSTSLSIVLEMVGDKLDNNTLAKITEKLYKQGFIPLYEDWISPETRIHALDTMGHNWWCVCVAAAGIALLYLKEQDCDYELHMKQIANSLDEWFRYPGNILQNKNPNWSADGDFIEFIPYMTYALSNAVILDTFYYNKTGTRIIKDKHLAKTPEFITAFLYQNENDKTECFNFADGYLEANCRANGSTLLYLAARYHNADLLDYVVKTNKEKGRAIEALFYPTEECKHSKTHPLHIYNHAGVASLKKGNLNFAAKTGESWNHNHLDAGHFIIVKDGYELISDSGSCPYSYPEYIGYFITPDAHNVITKDSKGINEDKRYYGTKHKGTFPAYIYTENFTYLLADATAPYNDIYERFYRHFLFLGNTILLIDDVQSHTDGKLSFLLHSKGEFKSLDDKLTVNIKDCAMDIYPLYPQNSKIEYKTGYRRNTDDITARDVELYEHPYISINTMTENCRQKFITCFTYGIKPTIKTAKNCEHIIIPEESGSWHIIVNNQADGTIMHNNAHLCMDNIKTDAFISFWFESENIIQSFGAINGSYLKIENKTYYSSLLKADFYAESEYIYANVTSKTLAEIKGNELTLCPKTKIYKLEK